MIPSTIRGRPTAVMLAVVVLLSVSTCADPAEEKKPAPYADLDPSSPRPILHIDTDDTDLLEQALAAIREGGPSAEWRAAKDVPAEDRGIWEVNETGWFLFVRGDEKDRAMAAYRAWVDATFENVERGGPAPIEPMVFGPAKPMPKERVRAIREELAKRHEVDQAVRKDPSRHGEMAAVDKENTAWLVTLVKEIGWIDAERFGAEAADAAFLLMQHSGDLALMKGALPEIIEDVQAGRLAGQDYALLYDRIMLLTGGMQRYGTQIVVRDDGRQVVERLEDPDRVDERRRQLGLGPLEDYLDGFDGEIEIGR